MAFAVEHCRGIDTIALKHYLSSIPPSETLLALGGKPHYYDSNGSAKRYVFNGKKGSHKPRLTLSQSPQGLWHVRVEVSPNAWLYGSNIRLSNETDIKLALSKISPFVSERINSEFNAFTAQVSRTDFAEDFKVGESQIISILTMLSKVSMPRYYRQITNDTTVYFMPVAKQKNIIFKFYSKYADVIAKKGSTDEQNAARGVLRMEVSYMTRDGIIQLRKKAKLPSRNADVILTPQMANFVLDDARERLQFDSILAAIDNEADELEKLHNYFGKNKAMHLIGFLAYLRKHGTDFYKLHFLNWSKSSYFADLKLCRKAGIIC